MPTPCLRTHELAQAVGIHPNAVRMYELWRYLPPIPRSPSGYRLFTQAHPDQLRLARLMLSGVWGGRPLRDLDELCVREGCWIGEAAHRLGVTPDVLRNWDRNGLLRVPRDPQKAPS